MCGIVGYIGDRNALPILINCLRSLEYRGYDSAGIAFFDNGLHVKKKAGKVEMLEHACQHVSSQPQVGIGHTRWATHGEPSDRNAHPHLSTDGKIAIVHNGIVENYADLKIGLLAKGYKFVSETDTEVLVRLIEDIKLQNNVSLADAVRLALKKVVGAYAIVVMDEDHPNHLIAARRGSPLVVGVGLDEYYIASDVTPLIGFTKKIIYLNDEEIVCLGSNGINVVDSENVAQAMFIEELDMDTEVPGKGIYGDFMLKEIHEQPKSVQDSLKGRIFPLEGKIVLNGIAKYDDLLRVVDRIVIIACGTSWHAGLIGEYLIENYSKIPVEVEYASEFRYRNPIIRKNDLVIAISQSGETADTIAAIHLAKSLGAIVFGICNVVGSSISRYTDAGIYTHVGPEIGVASTKAFSGQVTVLTMLALYLAQLRQALTAEEIKYYVCALSALPEHIEQTLSCEDQVREIAKGLKDSKNCLFLGRGIAFPVALEGALKLKEISYIHAEGYPAAEMKHGPIALIDKEMTVVFIATNHSYHEKIVNNIQEVKARKGQIISVVSEHNSEIGKLSDSTITIPHCDELLIPIIASIPLQLLAYHVALIKGCNVDQPRNLAKSVTVE